MSRMQGWRVGAALLAVAAAGCQYVQPHRAARQRYAAGKLAMERGEYDAALAELARAVERDRTFASAYAAIGDIQRKRGNFVQAARAYEQACENNPYDFRPHYNLGVTYQLLAEAARTAENAAEWISKAVNVYLRAVATKPGDFEALLNLSVCYFQQGRNEQAEQYCRMAIDVDPDNPYAYSNLGIIYDSQNRPYDAIKAYKDSLERDVHQPRLLLNLGATYHRLGWTGDAIHAYKLAAQEDPMLAAAYEQMGACYVARRQWTEAVDAFKKAAQLDESSAVAYRGLGVVFMARYLIDSNDSALRDSALEAWRRSLALDPRQPELQQLIDKYGVPKRERSRLGSPLRPEAVVEPL